MAALGPFTPTILSAQGGASIPSGGDVAGSTGLTGFMAWEVLP